MAETHSITKPALTRFYDLITGDEDARVCKDIPDDACRDMPANFFLHMFSSVATKVGDELASAKLVLSWIMTSLGAPGFLTGFLVPIRESGALLPQLLVAAYIRRVAVRKWFWVVGSVLQAASVLGMGLAAATFSGAIAGWLIVLLLIFFSLSRGVCSVASKDVLGKTVSKTRRGTLAGYSTAAAGLLTVLVGIYAGAFGSQSNNHYVLLLAGAAALWLGGALIFSLLREPPGATEGGGNAIHSAIQSLGLLRSDPDLRHFILTRALLLSTALSFPFYAMLAREEGQGNFGALGIFIIASGLAGTISAPVWGRLADRSSRLVMVFAAILAGAVAFIVFSAALWETTFIQNRFFLAGTFLAIGLAHSGVRIGRKTYLLDMATTETRAAYVALSNTIIGVLILLGGLVGGIAQAFGASYGILFLGVAAWAAAVSAWRLKEVQT